MDMAMANPAADGMFLHGPLVDADWLLHNRNLEGLRIIDARRREDYDRGHIPGALHLDVYGYMAEDTRRPEGHAEYTRVVAGLLVPAAIQPTDMVIWYDDRIGMRETRGYWFLRYMGHQRTAVLNGGLDAWLAAGGPLSKGTQGNQSSSPTKPGPPQPDQVTAIDETVFAGIDQVAAGLDRDDTVIFDVRGREEYEGKKHDACCPRPGRIPGAVWMDWAALLAANDRFRQPKELQGLLAAGGITKDKHIIVYCHRGARSSTAFVALEMLGYPFVRNFGGSWHEWSRRFDLPVETD